jgi:hypothetical protein
MSVVASHLFLGLLRMKVMVFWIGIQICFHFITLSGRSAEQFTAANAGWPSQFRIRG